MRPGESVDDVLLALLQRWSLPEVCNIGLLETTRKNRGRESAAGPWVLWQIVGLVQPARGEVLRHWSRMGFVRRV